MTSESSNELTALESLDDELVKDRAVSENEQDDASESASDAEKVEHEEVAAEDDR